jgi:hypothetical protein
MRASERSERRHPQIGDTRIADSADVLRAHRALARSRGTVGGPALNVAQRRQTARRGPRARTIASPAGLRVRGVGPATGGAPTETGGSHVRHPATSVHAARVAAATRASLQERMAVLYRMSPDERPATRGRAARRAQLCGGVQVGCALPGRSGPRRRRVLVHQPAPPRGRGHSVSETPARPLRSASDADARALTVFPATLVGRERGGLLEVRGRRAQGGMAQRFDPRAPCGRRPTSCSRTVRTPTSTSAARRVGGPPATGPPLRECGRCGSTATTPRRSRVWRPSRRRWRSS